MTHLLQAATMPQAGPSWQSIAVVCGALLQGMVLQWMSASAKDRKELRDTLNVVQGEVKSLNTHVGVDGNGITARLDEVIRKLDKLADEVAENRGARHIRTQGGH
jgi:hypothetical protein